MKRTTAFVNKNYSSGKYYCLTDSFGASRYIAKSAMEISAWFDKQNPRIQRLIRNNVQNWSVSALRQLTKVSENLVKELVGSGKKTARDIKAAVEPTPAKAKKAVTSITNSQARNAQSEGENGAESLTDRFDEHADEAIIFKAGVRVVVVNDNSGWSGCSGIIISDWDNRENSWWVLLDAVVAQGLDTKKLFKTEQLKPESLKVIKCDSSQKEYLFTEAQVEERVQIILAKREKEKAQEELARYVEIRDAALKAADEEISAQRLYAESMAKKAEELRSFLEALQEDIARVNSVQTENEQLKQRIQELENALLKSNENGWGNTFTKQAEKVINKNLAATIAPLQAALSNKEEQIKSLSAIVEEQKQEIEALLSSSFANESVKNNNVFALFGESIGQLGLSGWSRRGYCSRNGNRFTGVEAIIAFVEDLASSGSEQAEFAFN